MLETHLKSPVTQHRLRSGPATQHVDAFAEWLHRQGYRPVTIDTTLRSLAGWTDWMREAGLSNHLRRDSSRRPGIMRSPTPLESGPRLHSGGPTSHNRGVRIIGNAAKERDHQSAVRRRGVGPGLAQRSELRAGLGDAVEDVQEIARRSRQPVKPGDDYRVALTDDAQEFR